MTPATQRAAVAYVQEHLGFSERHACRLVGIGRSTARYRPRRSAADDALRQRLHELARARPRFGYRRLHILLRRDGILVNHKRVARLYRLDGLAVRRRTRKRVARRERGPQPGPVRPNEHWALDFLSDALASGRRIRLLTVVDLCTREALAIEVDTSLPGERVVRVLERIAQTRGRPTQVVLDNGPELTGKAVGQGADQHGVELRFIDPGKPVQNAVCESFNGRFRDECLNEHWFLDLSDARQIIESWRRADNQQRPHSALGYQTPAAVHGHLSAAADPLPLQAGLT